MTVDDGSASGAPETAQASDMELARSTTAASMPIDPAVPTSANTEASTDVPLPSPPPSPPPCPAGWVWPVAGVVTSTFGMRGTEFHDAIDIAARMGSEVVAPTEVLIQTIAYQRRAGRHIVARTRGPTGRFDGPRLTLAHLSHTAVFEGDVVPQGAMLGLIGESGSATGPHLHFRVQRIPSGATQKGSDLEAIDPLQCLPDLAPASPTDMSASAAP